MPVSSLSLLPNPEDNPGFFHSVTGIVTETMDASPHTVLSFPIDEEKFAFAELLGMVYDAVAFDPSACAIARALFKRRAGGGTLTRQQAPQLSSVVSNFTAPQPQVDLQANAATNSIDVVITGKVGMDLRWNLQLKIYQTP